MFIITSNKAKTLNKVQVFQPVPYPAHHFFEWFALRASPYIIACIVLKVKAKIKQIPICRDDDKQRGLTKPSALKNCVGGSKEKRLRKLLPKANFGRSDTTRTCDPRIPNKSAPIFSLIYKAFQDFWVRKRCFRMLSFALFPRSPRRKMVKTVVNHKSPADHRRGNLCCHS